MKTVFDNRQVVHVWAQQNQETSRSNNGHLHFTGPTLYSYNTPIAHFIRQKITRKARKGAIVSERKICLITTETYSTTTSGKHMPRFSDMPSDVYTFYVKHIGVDGGRAPSLPNDWIKQNFLEMAIEHKKCLAALLKARTKSKFDSLLRECGMRKRDAARYAETMGLRLSVDKHFPEPNPEALATRTAKFIQDELKATEKEARIAIGCQTDIDRFLAGNDDLINVLSPHRARDDQREPLRLKLMDMWRRGLTRTGNTYRTDWPTALRLKDAETVETTQGAQFPLAHGLKALPFIRRVVKSGEAWQRNGQQIRLGNFQIDRIEPDGTVIAGCHTVPYAEIEILAAQVQA